MSCVRLLQIVLFGDPYVRDCGLGEPSPKTSWQGGVAWVHMCAVILTSLWARSYPWWIAWCYSTSVGVRWLRGSAEVRGGVGIEPSRTESVHCIPLSQGNAHGCGQKNGCSLSSATLSCKPVQRNNGCLWLNQKGARCIRMSQDRCPTVSEVWDSCSTQSRGIPCT